MNRLVGRQVAELDVVVGVKPRKQIRPPNCARCSKVGADQPVTPPKAPRRPFACGVALTSPRKTPNRFGVAEIACAPQRTITLITIHPKIVMRIQAADRPHHSRSSSFVTQLVRPVNRKLTNSSTPRTNAGAKLTYLTALLAGAGSGKRSGSF